MAHQDTIWQDLQRIRAARPLVHNITNYVVMNTTANALLALGASPVMAHALEEVEEMATLAGSLVLNIGTLSPLWVEAMFRAGHAAHAQSTPIVLDPVGCGATRYRTDTARQLLEEIRPEVVRGNASEILALAHSGTRTKGVDSSHGTAAASAAARELAAAFDCVVCVSGAVDLISSATATFDVHNGHPLMGRITGMGCTASAFIGAFAAVNPAPLKATVHAMAVMGIAGELASRHARGPGSLQMVFLDELAALNQAAIAELCSLEQTGST